MSEVTIKIEHAVKWEFADRKTNTFKGDEQLLKKQTDACAVHTKSVIDHLKLFGFDYKAAFLKMTQPGIFNIIIAVREQDFINPVFLNIYDYVINLEDQVGCLTFSFLDIPDQLNELNLESDGYHMTLKAGDEISPR